MSAPDIWDPGSKQSTLTFELSNGEQALVTYAIEYDSSKTWPEPATNRALAYLRDAICRRWLFFAVAEAHVTIASSDRLYVWTRKMNLRQMHEPLDHIMELVREHIEELMYVSSKANA